MPRLLLLTLCLLTLAPAVSARPAYRKALADLLDLPAASRLNDCRVCHLPAKAGDDEADRPHNTFGARLKAVRAALRKANLPHDITARVLHIVAEDADGDGTSNLLELLAGTSPGDGTDRPTQNALTVARVREPVFLAALNGYRWRPFERVERPDLPILRNPAWVRNPIDVFIAAEHSKRSLTPRPEANRAALLRRVTIDLTGLPPTVDELHAFLADPSPLAYEKVVDRLLASPRYGERWGRHWMDVWRYSDWAGFGAQIRDSQPHIWHWRDWIIESLNADKGYDAMVREMLAADELYPTDRARLRATGFLVRNYKLLSREKWLQDAVDHTGQAFLGLTLGCARCHDHMYDPITRHEYYQVRAIFTPHNVRTDRLPGWPDLKANGLPRAYDAQPAALTFALLRGDDRTPEKTPLGPGVPEALGGQFTVHPVSLPREAYEPERQAFITEETRSSLQGEMVKSAAALDAARRNLAGMWLVSAAPLDHLVRLMSAERSRKALERAELDVRLASARLEAFEAVLRVEGLAPGEEHRKAAEATVVAQRKQAALEAKRAFLLAETADATAPAARKKVTAQQLTVARQALAKAEANLTAPVTTAYQRRTTTTYPQTSTGRRRALAEWLTHRDNPLAARVAANHLWLRHFGEGLAPTAFDMGRNGQRPTHPALLDWLAVELLESGWSMKHLHRLLVTSATYRLSSTPDAANLGQDADNVYLWRFAPRRAEAEVVRDALFFVADRLEERMSGPDIAHALGLTVPRRSLYFQHAAEKVMEFLEIFDCASVTECYQRKQAIMPQQALALINSEWALRHARMTARRLHTPALSDGAFVARAFEHMLTRQPTSAEQSACAAFLREQGERFAASRPRVVPPDRDGAQPASDPVLRARENLLLVLVNHHEFVTLR